MRLGVLDVGSNTVHLLVVDAHQGARPVPAFSHKAELRLGDHLDAENRLSQDCATQLRDFVDEALRIAEDKGVQELLAFATSAVRDAVNGDEVLAWIQAETQVDIRVLPGADESRLTFLAARRWFGWSSGRLLMLDIGGGSLEIAAGVDEEPAVAVSLPLGAGRLTRDWLVGDPPSADEVRQLRKHVRAEIAATAGIGHARRPPGPRRGHVQDIPAAGQDHRCGAVQRRPVRPAAAASRRRHGTGRPAVPHLPPPTGPSCPGCPAGGPRSSSRARSWPTPPWTCSACPRSRSAPGRCARA